MISFVRRRWRLTLTSVLLLALAAWALTPGPPRFRSFDAAAVGRAEAGLWRDYYERRHAQLALELIFSERDLFGLSPWDSARSGVSAALAARAFQRSRSRAEAQAALPELTQHFSILAHATHSEFDPATAARLELEWWQLRREDDSGPQAYAPAIAAATGYIYDVDSDRLAEYARLRSEAMGLRDARGVEVSDEDWPRISDLLERAYAELRAALA